MPLPFFISESGNVYVWGYGADGQLGLGNNCTFQSSPKKLRHSELRHCVVKIEAGEYFSTAITGTQCISYCIEGNIRLHFIFVPFVTIFEG